MGWKMVRKKKVPELDNTGVRLGHVLLQKSEEWDNAIAIPNTGRKNKKYIFTQKGKQKCSIGFI